MVKTTVKIDGMQCGMCEAHMNDAVRNEFKVKKVTSSHSKNQTEIISEKELDVQKLKDLIQKTGYTYIESKTELYVKKGLFHRG